MKKICLLYSVLFCFSTLLFAQKYEDREEWGESVQISMVSVPGGQTEKKVIYKYGLVNDKGGSVTGMEYENIIFTEDGMAIVTKDGKRGMMDNSGKLVIGMIYDKMYPFAPGKLRVKKGDRWGVIDYKGKTVLPFVYDVISEPLGGVVKARKNKKFGLMTMSAKQISPFAYDYISLSGDGKTCIAKKGEFYTLLDPVSGKELTPLKYTYLYNENNYIRTTITNANGETYGIIDKEGKECIPCIYNRIDYYKNNVAIVEGNYRRYGLVACGKELTRVAYDRLVAIKGGLFIGQSDMGEDQLLDSLGKTIVSIPKEFRIISYCDNGFLQLKGKDKKTITDGSKTLFTFSPEASIMYQNGLFIERNKAFTNLYNIKGDTISQNEYTSLSFLDNSDNLLIATKEGKTGIIDASNKVIIPFEYDKIYWMSKNNHIRVVKDGKCGMIDLNDKVVIPFEYKAIYTLGDDKYKAEKEDGLSAILEKTGKLLVPAKYASVYPKGNFYEVVYALKSGIIDRDGNEIVAPQYNSAKDYSNGMFIVVNREEQ